MITHENLIKLDDVQYRYEQLTLAGVVVKH